MDVDKRHDGKIVTIYDIAKEAGVSAATVSRVLTSNANVSSEKRARILELIEKYQFKPNALARGLSDTRSKVIGIIAADVRNPYYSKIFVACELAARKEGYTVLLCNSLGDKEQEEKLMEMLLEQRVDAIIQLGGAADDLVSSTKYVDKVNRLMNYIPVVVTGKLDGTKCRQVQIDAVKCIDLLMEHLLGLGHRKIAMIGGRMSVLSTHDKFQRYKRILEENQIEFRREWIAEDGRYNSATGYDRMNRMFELKELPTAVIAINDFTAVGVIKSIVEHGFHVPLDFSVVSYDNTNIAKIMIPRLTSVDYRYILFGEKLIATAIAASKGRNMPQIQMIEPLLVVGKSSGPAAQR
jgi:LacI family transcriptional regulator